MTVFAGAARLTSDAPDHSKMTKAQLIAIAETRGIDAPKGATKAQLLELIGG